MSNIKAADLHVIAAEYGKKPSAVRSAVNSKLIHPAERYGLGRAKGWEWIYPPGSDQALRDVFELQKAGVRGDALRFSLWWSGRIPFNEGVMNYIVTYICPRRSAKCVYSSAVH